MIEKTHKNIAAVRTGRYTVPVVRSTFRILEELSRAESLGVSEIAARTHIAKSTVFRILCTLFDLGYVVRDADRNYVVGVALAKLGNDEANTAALRMVAMPLMVELRNRFGETVNLGVRNFDKVTYVEVVPSEFALRMQETRGSAVPVHASALGKAILAFTPADLVESMVRGRKLQILTQHTISDPDDLLLELRRVRTAGFAFDRGEVSLLARCVAAPVIGPGGVAVGAISVSGPASRFNPRKDSLVIASLVQAAEAISAKLRARASAGIERLRRPDDAKRAAGHAAR
ncbi:MAG: IclR family transcriptional regulator [Terriglobales bacterium]